MDKIIKIKTSKKIIYSITCIFVTLSQVLMTECVEKIINNVSDGSTFRIILENGFMSLCFILLYQIISIFKSYYGINIVKEKIITIKEHLFKGYFVNNNAKKSEYISIFCNDIPLIESNYYMSMLNILDSGLTFFMVSFVIFAINKWIYAFVLLIILFNFLFNVVSQSSMNRNMNKISALFDVELGILDNYLFNYISIKNLNIDNLIQKRYFSKNKNLETSRYKYTFKSNMLLSLYNGLGFINIIIITLISSLFIMKGHINLGNLLGITILSNILFSELPSLMMSLLNIKSVTDIIYKISEKIDIDIKEKLVFEDLFDIIMNNVTVKYGKNTVLNGIDLKVNKGSKMLIRGGNGSGKSTLLSCLLNLVDYDGSIQFDNTDIKNKDVFGEIVYITKDSFIIDDSLEFNIFLDNTYVDEEIAKLVDILKIKKLLDSRKEDEIVDISSLSSGEKQKIEIFRTILKRPKCIIIDEGLSMIEDVVRKNIIEYLFRMKCTFLYVSHDNTDYRFFKEVIDLNDIIK